MMIMTVMTMMTTAMMTMKWKKKKKKIGDGMMKAYNEMKWRNRKLSEEEENGSYRMAGIDVEYQPDW